MSMRKRIHVELVGAAVPSTILIRYVFFEWSEGNFRGWVLAGKIKTTTDKEGRMDPDSPLKKVGVLINAFVHPSDELALTRISTSK